MDNYRNRKLLHYDGNDSCIKLSKSYSLGFDTFIFKIKFSTLFKYKKGNKSWQNGSFWWSTLSFKDKIFNRNHGLIKLFNCNFYYSTHPYHGVNTYNINICILPIRIHKYFDAKEDNCSNVSDSL